MQRNLVPILLLAGACASKDWRQAVKADTSAAYATYAARHRGEPRAEVALKRAEERAWAEAQATDTSIAYAGYAAAYPQGEHAAEANERAEVLAWAEAKQSGSIALLSSYLARYPNGPHAAEANQLQEQLWYDDARKANTEAAWGRYLVRYPQGLWADEARRERERLAWEATVPVATADAYLRFLDQFPDGAHADEARAWLAATKVSKLQPVVVLVGTWQAEKARAGVLSKVRGELERGLLADLKRWYTILPVKVLDTRGEAPQHPHDAFGTEDGVGLLVLDYTEVAGRTFEPSGHATDIEASLRLYAPITRNPLLDQGLTASTGAKVYGTPGDLGTLHTSAVKALGAQLRGYAREIEQHRAGGAPK